MLGFHYCIAQETNTKTETAAKQCAGVRRCSKKAVVWRIFESVSFSVLGGETHFSCAIIIIIPIWIQNTLELLYT